MVSWSVSARAFNDASGVRSSCEILLTKIRGAPFQAGADELHPGRAAGCCREGITQRDGNPLDGEALQTQVEIDFL